MPIYDIAPGLVYHDQFLSRVSPDTRNRLDEIALEDDKLKERLSEFVELHRLIGFVEGYVESGTRALQRILISRGIHLPAETRGRITACADLENVNDWLDRVFIIEEIDELFRSMPHATVRHPYGRTSTESAEAPAKIVDFDFTGYEWRSDFSINNQAIGRQGGRIAGAVHGLRKILHARNIHVPTEDDERIATCRDPHRAELWVYRALVIDTIDQLFD